MILAIIVFLSIIIFSAFETVHRTVAAMTGAVILLIFRVITQEEAIQYIDFNTLGLIIGMMIIVDITKRSGFFHYLAYKTTKLAKADPVKLLIFFPILAGVMAAFMDAVTAAILLAPIVFLICSVLDVDFFPFFLIIGIAVNIGGTATMVGDPPNVLIGSAAKLTFLDFIYNVAPVSVISLIAAVFIMELFFKKGLKSSPEMQNYLMNIDEKKSIQNKDYAKKSKIILIMVILAFAFHNFLHLEVATIAIAGAAILLFITRIKPNEVFEESDFLTIFFFIGLFICVGALVKTGVISFLSLQIFHLTEGHPFILTMTILWFSAIASAIIDNIPLVACLIPLIKSLPGTHAEINVLWFALSLGACFGGNGTLIGASSNLILSGISEKYGEKITFFKFTKYGLPIMLGTVILSSIYLYLRYF